MIISADWYPLRFLEAAHDIDISDSIVKKWIISFCCTISAKQKRDLLKKKAALAEHCSFSFPNGALKKNGFFFNVSPMLSARVNPFQERNFVRD
ncbi:hypothetical protein TNCT_95221 [Trichonephila clavata]|uniref:Uncharacterized protein n=1 Tax=Trichonephila clavata TaxID=2740835 RepID=A0A8X6M3P9_TRICU|nr:hypothetical protein TNCT_95221 [Trichonephila clavata]